MTTPFHWAQESTNNAMRDLNRHLADDDIIPAHVEKLQALSAQLWEMENLARRAEHALSDINAEHRAEKQAHP